MINLGDEVKDDISGFTGIATGRAVYLTGCVQIQITTSTLKGEPVDHWIDEQRLLTTNTVRYVLPRDVVEDAPAGPQNNPKRTTPPCGG